jgi:hypothetical protein
VLQESIALTLAVTNSACNFAWSLLTLYIDNDGVLATLLAVVHGLRIPMVRRNVLVQM